MEAAIQGFYFKIVIRFNYTWEIPVGGSFPVKLRAVCLLFCWKWVPSWVFVKYLAYFINFYLFYFFIFVNDCFGGTNPGGCLIILSTLFILILHGRKLFWRALFAVGFLINNWYCVSCLLNINSALVLERGFLYRWLIYWHNTFINFQVLQY